MRDLFSKLMTASMVAGAALLVSACGGSESSTSETNTSMEMNTMESTEGSMNDVTAVDATMGADANMMGNDMGNSMGGMDANMSGNTTEGGNAM